MNDFLKKFLSEKSAPRPLAADEYIDVPSGLVYCKNCHTPRQASVEQGGILFHPYCLCQCQSEARDREFAEERLVQEQIRISHLKANGLQDAFLREFTFAGCIANALLDRGIPVLMTNFARILNALNGMYAEDRNRYIDSLNQYSLLIIDDLGAERGTEYALEQVFNIVDARLRSNLPMIVTTNLTLNEMKYPADLAHAHIYSRVLERCSPLKINNQNILQLKAQENFARTKLLLSENENSDAN